MLYYNKVNNVNLLCIVKRILYSRLSPSHNAYILMSVALGAHATFMADAAAVSEKTAPRQI